MTNSREWKRGLRTVRLYTYGVTYALIVAVLMLSAALSPAYALQLSNDKYVRVIQQAEMIAFKAAQRATIADAVAVAALVVPPVGLAFKVLVGVGSLALGVQSGVALYETFYPSEKLAAIKTAASPVTGLLVSGFAGPIQTGGSCTYSGAAGGIGFTCTNPPKDQWLLKENCSGTLPSGWSLGPTASIGDYCSGTTTFRFNQIWMHTGGGANPLQVQSTPPTQTEVKNYVQALPAGDTNSIETNTTDKGVGVATATSGSTVTVTQAVAEGDTVVKKSTDVAPTDTVVAKDVPPPVGTVTTTATANTATKTATETKTTTVVTNPDGSTTATSTSTSTETEAQSASCSNVSHAPRTMASALQEHQELWKGTAFVGSISTLSNLVFTGDVPILSLPSSLFGTFTVDLNTYSWVFLAIKSILIALAGMVAIRLVFVGGA